MQEKSIIGMQLTEAKLNVYKNEIRKKNPVISRLDLKIELLKKMYRDDLSSEFIDAAVDSMRKFWKEKLE